MKNIKERIINLIAPDYFKLKEEVRILKARNIISLRNDNKPNYNILNPIEYEEALEDKLRIKHE